MMGEMKAKMPTKRQSKRLHVVEVKLLAYACVYEFHAVLQKGVNLHEGKKDVLDPSVLDPNNAIDKAKIKMKQKNDGHGIHFYNTQNKYHSESCQYM